MIIVILILLLLLAAALYCAFILHGYINHEEEIQWAREVRFKLTTNCPGYHYLLDAGEFWYDWESDAYKNDEYFIPAHLIRNGTITATEVNNENS